eukprot:Rhum_TRINITY_DN9929_c0_g1::Rhum_TRINITY_DN9929_c0_g1_i1::g.36013::m.36013
MKLPLADLGSIARQGLKAASGDTELAARSFQAADIKIPKRPTPSVLVVANNPFRLVSYGVFLGNIGCIVELCLDTRAAVAKLTERILRWRGPKGEGVCDCVFVELQPRPSDPHGIDMLNFIGHVRAAETTAFGRGGRLIHTPLVAVCGAQTSARDILEQGYDHFLRPPFVKELPTVRSLLLPLMYRERGRARVQRFVSNYPKIHGMLQGVALGFYEHCRTALTSELEEQPDSAAKRLTHSLLMELDGLRAMLEERDVRLREAAAEGEAGGKQSTASITAQLKTTTAELIKYKRLYERNVDALVSEKVSKAHCQKLKNMGQDQLRAACLRLEQELASTEAAKAYLTEELQAALAARQQQQASSTAAAAALAASSPGSARQRGCTAASAQTEALP